MVNGRDDPMVFAEGIEQTTSSASTPWKILIVDDDSDVHSTTKLALKGLLVDGFPVRFAHAYSAAEGEELLRQNNDFSVALIDVVMESDDSGLNLARNIRDKLDNHSIRLILRTGQPGYAPESDTIRLYDINDYKTKSELTSVRLINSISLAIRSYSQIKQLEANHNGLEKVLAASSELSRSSTLNAFASGITKHLSELLNVDKNGLVCADLAPSNQAPHILAAQGQYSGWRDMALANVPETPIRQQMHKVVHDRQSSFHNGVCLYFSGTRNQALVAFVQCSGSTITSSLKRLLDVFCSSVSVAFENLQLYNSIEQLAFQDSLLGLPNRNGLLARIEHQLHQPALASKAVALIDLDNFSYVNSVLDDAFGDDILKAVARRLTSNLSANSFVARISGDVFGVLSDADDLVPDRIEALFSAPFALHQNEPLRISATSGVIVLDQASAGATGVLKNAGVALKQAKHFYRGKTVFFAAEFAEAARDRMQMLSRLRIAFSDDRLALHFQPFVRLNDGVVTGAECLLRWQADDGQFIPPDQFIPLAEQSGMMVALGHWITLKALRWRSSLIGKVEDSFRVAINVSLVQLKENDFVDSMLRNVQEQGLQGHQVELELTESVAADDVIGISQKLKELRAQGLSISLDDFGTGYSSLSILNRLPIDRLKIDRSFISGDAADAPQFSMVNTIKEFADNFHMRTIAEGIENEEQLQALGETGCQEGQGYFFSRPLNEQRFAEWLTH